MFWLKLIVPCALLAMAAPGVVAAQGRPSCTTVLRKLNDAGGANKKRVPDASKIAGQLGVDAEWVERCAEAYGRRVKKHEKRAAQAPDDEFAERREVEEYEELSREERETIGDTYYTMIENDAKDRRKLKRSRDADSINEWNPVETHEWQPDVGPEWKPFLHDDDLGNF